MLAAVLASTSASAQVFGTFAWQMQPYCNVIRLTITQFPAGYTVDGYDDQCGAATRASATGQVHINPNGTVGVNFAIITTPAGKAVHVAALLSPANGSGTWTDSVGNSGTFALGGSTPLLPARPLPTSGLGASVITTTEIAAGAVGASDINSAEVQSRVTGTCSAGQAVSGINANGTVVCASTQATVQFRAQGLVAQALPADVRNDLRWASVTFNDGGGTYDAATGIYTVPTTGLYQLIASGSTNQVAAGAGTYRFITLHVNGTIVQQAADSASDTYQSVLVVAVRKFAAGDQIKISMIHNLAGAVSTFTDQGMSNIAIVQLR